MNGKLRFVAFTLALVSGLAPDEARAAAPAVYLTGGGTESNEALGRIHAELQSEGYVVVWALDSASPCDAGLHDRSSSAASAWISVRSEARQQRMTATICYAVPGAAPEETSLWAPERDHRRLALATAEALNGLRAGPRNPRRDAAAAPIAAEVAEHETATAAIFAQTSMTLEAFGGRPVVGAGLGLDAMIRGPLSFELDALVPLRPAKQSGLQRELSLYAAWVRLGPRLSWTYSPIAVGVSLQAGAAMIWANARTTPPLIGSTEATGAAIVSGGFWLECPDASTVYLRAGAHVSRLLPTVNLALGGGETQPFGQLLVDTAIGFGVRWGGAR